MAARYNQVCKSSAAEVQTSNATPTALVTFDLSAPGISSALDGVGLYVEGIVIAKTSANVVGSARVGLVIKRIAGVLTSEGALILLAAGAAGALLGNVALVTALATLDVTGNTVRLMATGIAATTINWTGHMMLWSGEFSG